MDKQFPIPFAGITKCVRVPDYRASVIVASIVNEPYEDRPHFHNFAVETDTDPGYVIFYGSDELMDCIQKILLSL